MKKVCLIFLFFITNSSFLYAQSVFDSVQFFVDEDPLDVTLTTDMSTLMSPKIKDAYLKATFTCKLPDSSTVTEEIRVNARGNFRRSYCFIPPTRLSFRNPTSPKLYSLNTLKLVCPCRNSVTYEQFLLKEFLIYKMYNLLTDKSFRVRLLRLTYKDSKGKKKPFTGYSFLVENVDAMAKRNYCKEWKKGPVYTEMTDRNQMTMVAVFQYMVGNTDWSIPNNHNIKLIYSKKDSIAKPYVVPYDFDYTGLVNADYAIPNSELEIETVVQRLYRGFPRTMDELQDIFEVYNKQKENIYTMIKNFAPLSDRNKKEIIYYLDDFYKIINDRRGVESVFISNARK